MKGWTFIGLIVAVGAALMGCMEMDESREPASARTGTEPAPARTPEHQESTAREGLELPDEPFERVVRSGSVSIDAEYDLSGLSIPKDRIHTFLPRDSIPALTDPKRQPASAAEWLSARARIIVVEFAGEVLGVPLSILDWHEIANVTVGGMPLAVTYCPLCDSAAVFSRQVRSKDGAIVVLEFGVSGALHNSNVLMYDRRDRGLWSQISMRAVSGPLVGVDVDAHPVRVMPLAELLHLHPDAELVARETGHDRDYGRSPYRSYFEDQDLLVPVEGVGGALQRKTLGVGVMLGDRSWFVTSDACESGIELSTPAGPVRLQANEAGMVVGSAPPSVRTVQTFYFSWSAFFPSTVVVSD